MRKFAAGSAIVALLFLPLIIIGATRTATLPPFDTVTDIGKTPVISSTGSLFWLPASSVTGAVIGPTSATTNTDLAAWVGTGGRQLRDSGIPLANAVLVSRAVQAGTGMLVTNSGLLSADITMSMAPTGLTYLSPQTTKGDLIAFSTLPTRLAVGTTGQILQGDTTQTNGMGWVTDRFGVVDGSSATTGNVGEVRRLTKLRSAAVALTSNITCNIGSTTCPATGGTQSITLTPGDWSCSAQWGFVTAATTSVTAFRVAVSKVSNTSPANDVLGVPTASEAYVINGMAATVPGGQDVFLSVPSYRTSVSSNTTLYLTASCAFTVAALTAYGSLECQRVR